MYSTVLIDVRKPEEYRSGHVEGAQNLPIEDIASGILPHHDKSTKIELYCRSGGRSGRAEELLRAAGFTNVKNIGGLRDVGL